jgi:hypothetical protein
VSKAAKHLTALGKSNRVNPKPRRARLKVSTVRSGIAKRGFRVIELVKTPSTQRPQSVSMRPAIFRDESFSILMRRDEKSPCSLPVTRLFSFRMLSSPRLLKRSVVWSFALLSFFFLFAGTSSAWIYPEHRDITVLAVQKLDPERRAIFDRFWAGARSGHEGRLCEQAADAQQAEKPSCIDWAAWPAIAGDHSCSAENMADAILKAEWILKVADIAAELKRRLARAKDRAQRINAMRDSDIRLQRADQEYATRAGANNAHFLLARMSADIEGVDYVIRCLSEGTELNALGVYAWYHLSALEKASRLSRESLSPEQYSALSLAALADEAFALHFLEDTSAAGHVAGTWGDASQRRGTHDYYNEHGMEAMRWEGGSVVLMGDAWMRPEDAERAAETARRSLEQILDAASGRGLAAGLQYTPKGEVLVPDAFNACKLETMPGRKSPPGLGPLFAEVIRGVPVPGLGPGAGSLPRFRSELGPFVGLAMSGDVRGVNGGFGKTQETSGAIAGLGLALRLGLGLEGVLSEAGDGLVFLDLGVQLDSPSSMKIDQSKAAAVGGGISAAIPSRWGLAGRLRMPFWLIPGDLLLALPILAPISPETYSKMAVVAGNGGLIPWQAGIATPLGRFQFVLGREVGFTLYGYGRSEDRLIIPSMSPNPNATYIGLRSIRFDFPLLEYRPFRTFSLTQSSSLVFQLYGGFEVPLHASVVQPAGAPEPELRTIYEVGLRIVFDWRNYL